MQLLSWLKNFCIAGSLLTVSSIFPIIGSIDVLILNGKRVYIVGDVHEQLPICSVHRKLFFDFLQRLDKKSTHVIIEDSYGQLVTDNPTADKTSFRKSITDSFLDCLTAHVFKLGYSTRNIEFRNFPIKYWNKEHVVENRLKIFEKFYVPLFTEHKNIDTDNAILRQHYEAKMNLVIGQIETFKNIIIEADVKKYCIEEILLFLGLSLNSQSIENSD